MISGSTHDHGAAVQMEIIHQAESCLTAKGPPAGDPEVNHPHLFLFQLLDVKLDRPWKTQCMLAKTPLITTGISILHYDTMASNFLLYTPASVWISNRANTQQRISTQPSTSSINTAVLCNKFSISRCCAEGGSPKIVDAC